MIVDCCVRRERENALTPVPRRVGLPVHILPQLIPLLELF